jgi:hypothetical protein
MVTDPNTPNSHNPLLSFMRQPKIYIRLPSNGQYWPEGSLKITENGEYPVYSMTARDELMLKIPDAVMNGQAVVDVLQNCIPNIKNAWMTPSIDLDYILIAIRLATYGEKMDTPITFGDSEELHYEVDLRTVMDNYQSQVTWDPIVPINDDLTVFVRPLNYKVASETALKAFETQKIMQIISNKDTSEEDKLEAFKKSFNKLSEVTIGMVQSSIYRVDTSQGSTDNPKFIKEFVENVDKDIFNAVQTHLEKLKEINTLKPITVQVTEEMKEKGFKGDTVEVPLVFDPSTFFV